MKKLMFCLIFLMQLFSNYLMAQQLEEWKSYPFFFGGVLAIIEDSNDSLLIVTECNIWLYKNQTEEFYIPNHDIHIPQIITPSQIKILKATDGTIWLTYRADILNNKGISCYYNGKYKQFPHSCFYTIYSASY